MMSMMSTMIVTVMVMYLILGDDHGNKNTFCWCQPRWFDDGNSKLRKRLIFTLLMVLIVMILKTIMVQMISVTNNNHAKKS